MSRVIESESDTDNEGSDKSSVIEASNSLPAHNIYRTNSVLRDSDYQISNKTEATIQRDLEHYTRKLSQMGLGEDDDRSLNNDSIHNIEDPTITDLCTTWKDKSVRLNEEKVKIKFLPIGSISSMSPSIFKISTTQKFSMVITFLQKKLKICDIYCYVNNSFAPCPGQVVGDLWNQFKVNDELIVSYCGSVAFG